MILKTFIVLLLLVVNIYALPAKMQADRYLLQAKKSMQNKDYYEAKKYFEKILKLNIKTPNDFNYFYAKTLIETDYNEKALEFLDKFLTNGGDQTKHYVKALNMYTLAEKKAEPERIKKQLRNEAKNYVSEKVYDKHGNLYKTVKSPYTGEIWLDRNLGAKRVCQSYNDEECFGDYFQWGRDSDGHEKKYSTTTSSLSYSDKPNHDNFIMIEIGKNNNDWRNGQNVNLWQGVNGKNNPCPKGFRVPTIDELQNETVYQNVKNRKEGYNNFLKIPSSGIRYNDGSIRKTGENSDIWSSSIYGNKSYNLLLRKDRVIKNDSTNRRGGMAVRCIKG